MEQNNEAGCNVMQWVISENIHTSPKEEIPTHYQKQFFSPLPLQEFPPWGHQDDQ
jgi:hypothetical protein